MTSRVKKKISIFIFALSLFGYSHGQKCATTYRDSIALQTNPNYLKQRIERIARSTTVEKLSDGLKHTLLYIPTVVHVIHTSEAGIISDDPNIGNISKEQIMSQIEVLNQDYRRKFGSPGFNDLPEGADMEIEFCLAKLDPQGQATDGITRNYRPKEEYDASADDGEIKGIVHWPADQYMNVYVVPRLSDNFLGYASFPEDPRETDGIVMSNRYFGNRTGTSIDAFAFPYNRGRTMTHEVGHWLGLVHIWGDGNCAVDDGCDDTPDSDAGNFGCDTTHESCGSPDMVRNYMDYSDDHCFNIFSQCQKLITRNIFDANLPNNRSSFLLSSLTGSINCDLGQDTTDNNPIRENVKIGTIDQVEGRYLIFNLDPGTDYNITIFNLQGKRLENAFIRSNAFGEIQFALSAERRGIYIMKIHYKNGDTQRFKIYGPLKP
ncbi:MAG: M43 family zinc metalloprotease [Cytophagales bacterium]